MSKLMKNKKLVSFLVVVLVLAAFVLFFKLKGMTEPDNFKEKYAGKDLDSANDAYGRENTYDKYFAGKDAENVVIPMGDQVDPIDVMAYDKDNSKDVIETTKGEGTDAKECIVIPEEGYATYKVNVKEAGYYDFKLSYFPTQDEDDRGIAIETKVEINGKVPFVGADAISFGRIYTDAVDEETGKIATRMDNQGNMIRAQQVEDPNIKWVDSYFEDSTGYQIEPYKFYLNAGENTVRLTGVNEKLVLGSFEIKNREETPTYEEYIKANEGKEHSVAATDVIKLQGESAVRRSSPSLYPTYDRTSSDTEYENENGEVEQGVTDHQVLNMIGGTQWKVPNDYIEWELPVEKSGDYVIGIKGRQGYNRGYIANRALYIDGEIPFEGVDEIKFRYSNTWDMTCLQDENGKPYKVHLEKGTHTVRLKITLGELGKKLSALSDSVFRMNEMYRDIIVITGTEPDEFRDYKLDECYPEMAEQMKLESARLYKLVDEVVAFTGEKGGEISVAQTLAAQLEEFSEDMDDVPLTLSNFKENVSSLGTSINNLSATPMDIDYIEFAGSPEALTEVDEGGFDKVVHECKLFINSFLSDSSALGSVWDSSEPNVIDVWITAGRDQSTILKNMVDQSEYLEEKDIKVNVRLIDAANTVSSQGVNAMLPAVMSGNGPDVALNIAQTEPVNYALRGAVVDLSGMDGIDEILDENETEYYKSSYEAYKFNGGIYALPETQNYNVMFYRTDIMEELGIDATQIKTWQDVIEILPILQKNSMSFAVPSVERKIGNTTNPDLANYYAHLYQLGGQLYDDPEDAKETAIDTEEATKAFEFYTKLFTNYKLEKQYDFVNRFRSGEMPIGIADYSNFNTLAVFAPELKGLWNFAEIPGWENEETGEINNAVQSWGVCCMMLRGAEERGKVEKSWEFMKWWVSAETQLEFANELEAVMGASARYATANRKTFSALSWSTKEKEALEAQWEKAFGLPEVAGGYYTARHITNAIRNVMNNNDDPQETIRDYAITINEELTNKRQEFGLPTIEDEKTSKTEE